MKDDARSFTVVNRMQSAWEKGFDRLIYGMETLSTLYGLAPIGNVEKTITWGDGVLEDFDKETIATDNDKAEMIIAPHV